MSSAVSLILVEGGRAKAVAGFCFVCLVFELSVCRRFDTSRQRSSRLIGGNVGHQRGRA